ncbi:MAG TPA: hypothetical protein PK829_08925 [Promineifilum sp.]|nr:hypothetical protein [Promineifilum sp.]
MSQHDDAGERALQTRLAYLLDLDISPSLRPEERLLLAVLRQAVVDYFGDDPLERLSAGLYFARSPLYRMTLRQFGLPDHALPEGVDLSAFRGDLPMNADHALDPLRLETLVRQLSGTQLKVVLTMGLLSLPATTRKISLNCGLGRATVMAALDQLSRQGLVQRNDDAPHAEWSLGDEVRRVLAEVWGDGPHQIDHS